MAAVEVRRLGAAEALGHVDGLADVLLDCVLGGASVGYMACLSLAEARVAFETFVAEVAAGRRLLLAAFLGGRVVGTVQAVYARAPNQPHRADIAKLLVHRAARRHGVGQRLTERAEAEALAMGRTLLVLDTASQEAERLYTRLGWQRLGSVPGYALYPDGRPCATTFFWKALAPDPTHARPNTDG
jgi:ribosomal protein S18 acetylase RimI-like enzyme